MAKYYIIAILSGILSSFSQILLKKASTRARDTGASLLRQYLNPYVLCGYGLMALCMVLMIFAFRGLPYKVGPVLESLAYLYVMVLSRLFLGESITPRRLAGNLLIVAGVVIFNL